jgi:hypothetical protein
VLAFGVCSACGGGVDVSGEVECAADQVADGGEDGGGVSGADLMRVTRTPKHIAALTIPGTAALSLTARNAKAPTAAHSSTSGSGAPVRP